MVIKRCIQLYIIDQKWATSTCESNVNTKAVWIKCMQQTVVNYRWILNIVTTLTMQESSFIKWYMHIAGG